MPNDKPRIHWSSLLVAMLPLYPLLHFHAGNPVALTTETITLIGVAAVGGTLLIGAAAGMITRQYAASIAASSVLVLLLLSNGHLRSLLPVIGIPPEETLRRGPQLILHVLIAAVSVGTFFAVKHQRAVQHALAVMTVILLLFIVPALAGISGTNGSAHSTEQCGQPDCTAPVTSGLDDDAGLQASGMQPHILLLLLDGYGREDVLRDLYGFDNSRFVSALRERDFFVADSAAVNYMQTLLSLNSLFSMRPLDLSGEGVLHVDEAPGRTRQKLRNLYRHAPVWRLLGDAGYRLAATAMYWIPAPCGVHMVLRHDGIMSSFGTGLLTNETSWAFLRRLLHSPARREEESGRTEINTFMRELLDFSITTAHSSHPTLLFAHVLAPHPPFTLASDEEFGEHIGDGSHYHRTHGTGPEDYVRKCNLELNVLNEMLLRTVDEILESGQPLVLILMSDHGPGAYLDWDHRQRSNARERVASFFAVYSSHGDVSGFPHRITPVNVFPLLFNSHFGTSFPLHDTPAWYSGWKTPLQLEDVSHEVW
ncbi:MAG: sulfatase-like hydrolase/transferase [Bacteroidetes bacterium]|nr:sulfatase-like hydrolase/transferase [Bacteroidota bacterium]